MAREFIPGGREPDTPSSTFSYFFREAVRRLWISKRNSFVAIAMIAISLLILGSFLLVSENLALAVAQWQGKSRVNIFLDPEATTEQIRAVDTWLAAHPEFRQRHFVTKEEALLRFKRDFVNLSDVVKQLDSNPFPPSFECEVAAGTVQSRAFDGTVAALRALNGVDQVQFDWQWIARLKRLVDLINLAGIVAGGILAVAAAFTIANVIRLTMLLYREEIDIMRLVGATERIIRGPFLIEGILQGTLGGALAVVLLFGSFQLGRSLLAPSSALLWGFLFHSFLPWQKIIALILGGTVAGWLGSWLSVQETTEERI